MSDPVYDEDLVNLGYLKRIIEGGEENLPDNISRHYGSQPTPPYYIGDTWIDGNIVYTCINTRLIGLYDPNDWTTESGAKQEAEAKNKVFLRQPSDYAIGDMWILQTDEDHRAGKKGEILISTAARSVYDSDDWINMLGYGTIRSINEVANNIHDALSRLGLIGESGKTTIWYDDEIPTANDKDLWYVTANVSVFVKDKLYKYENSEWTEITDKTIVAAFVEANQDRLVGDGKIQEFYGSTTPTGMGAGDVWDKDGEIYRYNGTNWVPVYDTNLTEIRKNIDTVTVAHAELETDYGIIKGTVIETETRLNNEYMTAEQIEAENLTMQEDIDIVKQQQATMELTASGLQIQIDSINNEGVTQVKNTKVTIDEDGVTVGSANSEFSTTMNNEGTYMYAFGNQIAKYDKDGAETANFKATGEVELGYLKIVKATSNSENRTYIHWIGG